MKLARIKTGNDVCKKNIYAKLLLFNIKKTFDTIEHPDLIYKLIQFKFPDDIIIRDIQNYLSDRNFPVKMNNVRSTAKSIFSGGVPSIL